MNSHFPCSVLFLLLLLPASAQTIGGLLKTDVWELEVTVPQGMGYLVQTSPDLNQWTPAVTGLTGTGAVQRIRLGPASGSGAYFRLAKPGGSTSDKVLYWDLSEERPDVGYMMLDSANRFGLVELIEDADGMPRRNAGFVFTGGTSGKALMVSLGDDGLPLELNIDNEVIFEFLDWNRAGLTATWSARDADGAVLQPLATTAVTRDFFAMASGGNGGGGGQPPPSNVQVTSALIKGTVNFAGAAATNIPATKAEATLAFVGIMATPVSVAFDVNAVSGSAVEGTLFGINAAQCAAFIGSTAATGGTAYFLQMTSGTLACGEAAMTVAQPLLDAALQSMEAHAKVRELVRLGGLAEGQAGAPVDVAQTPQSIGIYSRNGTYFVSMHRALAMYNSAEEVINRDYGIIERLEALIEINEKKQAMLESAQAFIDTYAAMPEAFRSSLQAAEQGLPLAIQLCKLGEQSGCMAIPLFQEAIALVPSNIEVVENAVEELRALRRAIAF